MLVVVVSVSPPDPPHVLDGTAAAVHQGEHNTGNALRSGLPRPDKEEDVWLVAQVLIRGGEILYQHHHQPYKLFLEVPNITQQMMMMMMMMMMKEVLPGSDAPGSCRHIWDG